MKVVARGWLALLAAAFLYFWWPGSLMILAVLAIGLSIIWALVVSEGA